MKTTSRKLKITKNPEAESGLHTETINGLMPLYTRLQSCLTPEKQDEIANDMAICFTSALTLGLNLSVLNNN